MTYRSHHSEKRQNELPHGKFLNRTASPAPQCREAFFLLEMPGMIQ